MLLPTPFRLKFLNLTLQLRLLVPEDISQQEEVQIRDAQTFANDVKELHSRITTSTKEMTELMTKQHTEAEAEIRRLREDVTTRVGVLERWKYLIIGGSIVGRSVSRSVGRSVEEIADALRR